MSRWHAPADHDEQRDPGEADAPIDDDRQDEPTLRDLAAGALQAARFIVVRDWPINYLDGRLPMLAEVKLGAAHDADGYEVCVLQWWGSPKGAAMAQHQGAFEAARAALAQVGLYAVSGGGLSLEVGWTGTPEGWIARADARRREGVAA